MQSFPSPLKCPRGFSLVELLVVIAIIAMLVSLLFPSIKTGIQKAKATWCLSNLRQIGISVQQYVADPDNGHQFPPIYNVSGSNASSPSEVNSNAPTSVLLPLQCLGNYGVTIALLTCPSDTAPDTNYGSYLWSPVLQGEQPQDVHIYTRGGVFTISKLSTMTVCTDKGMPHLGKLNVLRADGHVEARP
jgi:prepilin-type N-terminal cleavage/methylation domain-containing protein/prepilin-type processing-associated H-X9-DG protein